MTRLLEPNSLQRPQPVALGVCARLALQHGAAPLIVRTGFAVLALAGGVGIGLYLLAWLFTVGRPTPPAREKSLRQDAGIVAATAAALAATLETIPSLPGLMLWPASLLAFALAFSVRPSISTEGIPGLAPSRILSGLVLMIGGIATGLTAIGDLWVVGAAVLAIAVGGGLVVGPWLRDLLASADEDHRERIRAEERADLSAHLHDSVLQTLTLIQNRASDPQVTAALAHQQERELRRWMYGPDGQTAARAEADTSLRSLLTSTAEEVEDQYLIVIECIIVGDADVTPSLSALVAATREAMVNAAKFSDSQLVSLYVEVNDDNVLAFVRDRGVGFDPGSVADDRRGIADSIHGRVERAGGNAAVKSKPGEGTEVRIEVPR